MRRIWVEMDEGKNAVAMVKVRMRERERKRERYATVPEEQRFPSLKQEIEDFSLEDLGIVNIYYSVSEKELRLARKIEFTDGY